MQVDQFDNLHISIEPNSVSKLEVIQSNIQTLPREQLLELQDCISRLLEDEAELRPEFLESIQRGNDDLGNARVRVRKAA